MEVALLTEELQPVLVVEGEHSCDVEDLALLPTSWGQLVQ
jgi:hypothetical protein